MSDIPREELYEPGGRYDVESPKGFFAFGVTTFAGTVLTVVSIFQILQGIAAIANDQVFVRGLSYTYELDVTSWGWIHLILGLVGLGTGVGILAGALGDPSFRSRARRVERTSTVRDATALRAQLGGRRMKSPRSV